MAAADIDINVAVQRIEQETHDTTCAGLSPLGYWSSWNSGGRWDRASDSDESFKMIFSRRIITWTGAQPTATAHQPTGDDAGCHDRRLRFSFFLLFLINALTPHYITTCRFSHIHDCTAPHPLLIMLTCTFPLVLPL